MMTTQDTLPTETLEDEEGYLDGQLLIAMPGIGDSRFEKTVIYICAHSPEGAMGLVVNREVESMTFPEMLSQLDIEANPTLEPIQVHFGGPVENGRGFVLHTSDYEQEGTIIINEGVSLTATIDILRDISLGTGPKLSLLALGYAGWAAGQLDEEFKSNGWLNVDSDHDLIFGDDLTTKWDRAMAKIGIDPLMLSDEAGHA